MKLGTRRLILRPLDISDAPRFHEYASLEAVAVPGGFPTPKSLAATRKKIRQIQTDQKKPGLRRMTFSILLRRDKTWIGGISLRWPHVGVGEIGYGLHPEHWGHGYASEAVEKILSVAFLKFDAHRVQANCWVKNRKSQSVLLRAGLKKEGRLRGFLKREGVVRDEFMFGITRTDWLGR